MIGPLPSTTSLCRSLRAARGEDVNVYRRPLALCSILACVVGLALAAPALAAPPAPPPAWMDDAVPPPLRARPAPEPPRKNRLEIGLGVVSLQLRDDVLAPLRWTGWGGELALAYERIWESGLLRVSGALPVAIVENRYGYEGAAVSPELGVQYTHAVARLPGASRLALGGRLRGRMLAQFYYDWDEEHLYWLTTYDISPMARFEKAFGERHAISAEAGIPLFALVSRPPVIRYYKIDSFPHAGPLIAKVHEKMRPASLDSYVAPDLKLAYVYRASRAVRIRAAYTLSYAREKDPEPFQALAQTLSAHVVIAF